MNPRGMACCMAALVGLFLATAGVRGLSMEDLVVAMPTFDGRHPLALATRSWRASMRTIITTNDTRVAGRAAAQAPGGRVETGISSTETYLAYPDELGAFNSARHAPRPGDVRSAITPFLAHSHLRNTSQTYKWLLYGEKRCCFSSGLMYEGSEKVYAR